ncbi:esterase/lipase family protein [Pendulispora albinea]|uniref:MYXO-CTERM sorting domain-containing protein n=1 Tax=Pendulispora albinea TaxID=2741071 RepID=A0ABZ2LVH3_9BACT
MRLLESAVAIGSMFVVMLAATPANADPLVGGSGALLKQCKLTSEKPYPVVLVHGQAGTFEGMSAVSDRLTREGYCVCGTNYGPINLANGGAYGQDHLWNSADQISEYIDSVLKYTSAKKVDVVGHSAGTGVLDNYVLKKGGASKVHAFVSFGGLHHPYAHLGVPRFFDSDVYLPNLLAFGRQFYPGLTVKQVADTLVSTFGLDRSLAATVQSPFAEDLFDATYWNDLHGGPSEPDGTFLRFATNGRSLPTHDSASGVCYTNIVGIADFLVGGSTGWQDEASGVENFLLTSQVTANMHSDMLGNEEALSKMLEGLRKDCGGGSSVQAQRVQGSLQLATDKNTTTTEAAAQKEFGDAFLQALERDPSLRSEEGGCTVSPPARELPFSGLFVLGTLVAFRRRRRVPSSVDTRTS